MTKDTNSQHSSLSEKDVYRKDKVRIITNKSDVLKDITPEEDKVRDIQETPPDMRDFVDENWPHLL